MTTSTPAKTRRATPKKRSAARPGRKGGHAKKVPAPRKSFSSRPTAPEPRASPSPSAVEVGEARERLGGSAEVFARATEELGRQDAAPEQPEPSTPDETGGPLPEAPDASEFFRGGDRELARETPPDPDREPE